MERNSGKGAMGHQQQQQNHEPVRLNSVEPRKEGLGSSSTSSNQRLFQDPSSFINTNTRPPDFTVPIGGKRVLNFSIQTGEEFALEFMRERVHPRQQHFIPPNNVPAVDSNAASSYIDLKGILGISHTGSESGSEISLVAASDKNQFQDQERKGTSINHEDKSKFGSKKSKPRNSLRNEVYSFSSVSEGSSSSSTRLKFLCSFGGKIMPRPSDGKLRYVGGETRIIRISKDITFQDFAQKTLAVYNEAHTIKYQLPGEDLDALVSVSCDEDFQNMMEECNSLEDSGSQKLRMFLFSASDLESSHLGLETVDGDSEMQYVVAVNGMETGSRRNSFALASNSENNELPNLGVDKGNGWGAADLARPGLSPLTVGVSLSDQSVQMVLKSSSQAFESNALGHQTVMVRNGGVEQRPLAAEIIQNMDGKNNLSPVQYDYGYHASNYALIVEKNVPKPLHGYMTRQGGLAEEQQLGSLHVGEPEASAAHMKLNRDASFDKRNEFLEKEAVKKEANMKRDSSIPKMNETANIRSSKNEHAVSSHPYDISSLNHISKAETPTAFSPVEMVGPVLPTESSEKKKEPLQKFVPSEAGKEENANKLNEDGQILNDTPTHHFRSERIPREQAGLKRLSKSDDSSGSQFFISHVHSEISQQITESDDNLPDENAVSHMGKLISSSKILHIDPHIAEHEGEQCENSKEVVNNYKEHLDNDKETLIINQEISGSHQGDSVSKPPDLSWVDMVTGKNDGNSKGQSQPSAEADNQVTALNQGKSSVAVGNSEQGDILIDIYDHFPRDFLSDIFSKAKMSGGLTGINTLNGDRAGLGMNVENHEPKHWPFFQKLAQDDSVRKEVSLIDQDHLGFSSPLPNMEDAARIDYSFPPLRIDGGAFDHLDSRVRFDPNTQQQLHGTAGTITMDLHSDFNVSHVNDNQVSEYGGLLNPRTPESEYEEGKLEAQNTNLLHVDYLALGDFDPNNLQIINDDDLEELKELGSGTFGTVHHGKWRGTDVAIKRIKKCCFSGRSSEQERLGVDFWREAEILSKLHHPNVMAFYGVVQDGPGGTLATVTEYMVNGSLRQVLLSKDRHLDRRKRLIIAMDAAFGMEYLHSKNIVHFDLKCDNLLVNLKDPARPICKVGDFGLSKIKRNTMVTGGVRGTLPWMAPELLNGSSSKVSEKVDIFSFGIVLWEILTGEEPYAHMHYGAIIGGIVNNTLRPPVPSYCDPDWKLLMEQCWAPDTASRPSFTEIARRLRVMSAAGPTKPPAHQAQNPASK